ncbi:hypothetical protein ACFSCX_09675 [Bacillus salitolerans]|uniref:Uncharacterized protein n=1 Tax=Bacillus salitolerans TaxID=1437434 RepID=A0ABW4LPP3_9BACI
MSKIKLRFISTPIYINRKEYKVLKPFNDFHNIYVNEITTKVFSIFGNESELKTLANLLYLLKRHKDIIIYLPLRKNPQSTYLKNRFNYSVQHDMVLLHHSVQLNTKDWKWIRNKFDNYNLIEICFEVDLPEWDKEEQLKGYGRVYYKENNDLLDLKSYAETLFIVGSSKPFYFLSYDVDYVSLNGRETFNNQPGFHEHEHIDYLRKPYNSNKGNGFALSVNFYDQELWGV